MQSQCTVNFPRKRSTGFTLVELLVVVSIIAILATVGILSYGSFIKNARDGKRQADLKAIQSALEQYFADQNFYPPVLAASGQPMQYGTKTYLNSIPSDPLPGNPSYLYSASGTGCGASNPRSCTSYCIWAKMEVTSAAISACPPPSNYNFAVTTP